jgi:hypothetical protein
MIRSFLAGAFAAMFAVVAAVSDAKGSDDSDVTTDAVSRSMLVRDVPDVLKSWAPWVLHGQPGLNCPFVYNAIENRRCVWPTKIAFALGAKGGTFSYQVELFAPATVALPGSAAAWPQSVTANGKPVQVTGTEPRVQLPAGSHTIAGNFVWAATPESLLVPEAVGIVSLILNGKAIEQPNRGDGGQLWLAQENEAGGAVGGVGGLGAAASQLTVRINRLIEDDIPTLLTTQLELVASGKNQEVILPNAVLNGFTLLELQSKLPARVEADGKLRVQVRAGRWEITLVARNQSPLMSLASPNSAAVAASVTTATTAAAPANTGVAASAASSVSLPADEVWAFKARNEHRLVTLEGLTAVDPQQTTLPKAWRQFPSFVVRPTETLKFNETKRGDPQPAPDRLGLKRNLWLDFDGRGYTVQDQISGTMNSSWRLEMGAPSVLGRAAVAGTDQFITTIPGGAAGTVGIEVRRGKANMVADSRIESDSRTLSAVGWQQDFNSVSANLHLPPGWRLMSAQGADSARTAWVAKWTLLDLFLLLMIALSFGRLFGVKWGAISLAAMLLAYHEGVPVATWLIALAVVALIRVLPKENKFAKFMQFARVAALLLLAVTLLPFMVSQIRQSIYPVLEKPEQAVMGGDAYGGRDADQARIEQKMERAQMEMPVAAAPPAASPAKVPLNAAIVEEPNLPAAELAKDASSTGSGASYSKTMRMRAPDKNIQNSQNATFRLDNYDSKAMIQTGPGLPGWSWNTHPISWSGPVEQAQSLSLWLISPLWSALLRVLSVILLGAMLLCVLDVIKRWPVGLTPKQGGDVDFSKFKFGKWSRRNDSSVRQNAASVSSALVFACVRVASATAHG